MPDTEGQHDLPSGGLVLPSANTLVGREQPEWGSLGCPGGRAGVSKASPVSLPSSGRGRWDGGWGEHSLNSPHGQPAGRCRAGEKGNVGVEGQMGGAWHTTERTFTKMMIRLALSHVLSKYFLSFSNVPATVPGSEATAISMAMPLLECDL